MEKASVSYGTDFSIAKQSGGWASSERLGNDAGVVIGDTEQTSTSPVADEHENTQ